MPLQSTGTIKISEIHNALSSGSYSLRTLSAAAGKSTPDAMSEFYGYSAVPVPYMKFESWNTSSYSGSGSTWYDLNGSGYNISLTNPSWTWGFGFSSSSDTDFTLPSGVLTDVLNWDGTNNFTISFQLRFTGDTGTLAGLFWSEDSGKNFLMALWYGNSGGNVVPRVDSCCTARASWDNGAGTTNQGASPAQATADYTQSCPFSMLTITKDYDNVFKWYVSNGFTGTTTLIWTTPAYTNWAYNYTQAIHLMCKSQGSYYAIANLTAFYAFRNQVLSSSDINAFYNQNKRSPC
jgi:hypothetical protein